MTEANVNNKMVYLKWLICFALAGVCFILPLGEAYNFLCQKFTAITVFCIALMAFDLLDNLLIGLLLPALWVLSGCATLAQALSGWSGSFLFMLLGAFILTNILNRCGLLKRVGIKSILLCGGTLNGAIWGLFFASVLLNAASFNMGLALPITLALAMYYSLGLTPKDPESLLVVLALLLGGIQSGAYIYSPISVSLIEMGVKGVLPDFTLSWMGLIAHNTPVFLFSMLLLWAAMKYVSKRSKREIDVQKQRIYFQGELDKLGTMPSAEKKAAVIFVLMVLYMLLTPIHGLDLSYGFFFAVLAMYLPFVNIGAREDIVKLGEMLPLVAVVFAFMSIGSVGAACGFAAVFANAVTPMMSSSGPIGSIYITLLLATLSNFILTPAAMLMLLSGPVVQFCTDLGYNFLPHIYSIYLAEHAVFHPYEWPSYMTVFAFGMLKMNDFIKLCSIKAVTYLIFIGVIIIPFWYFIGLI